MGSQIPDKPLPPKVVMQILNIGVDTLRRWSDRKKIPCVRNLNGQREYMLSDVMRIKAARDSKQRRAAHKTRKALDKLMRRLERGEITIKQERRLARAIKERKDDDDDE